MHGMNGLICLSTCMALEKSTKEDIAITESHINSAEAKKLQKILTSTISTSTASFLVLEFFFRSFLSRIARLQKERVMIALLGVKKGLTCLCPTLR